jgi:oxalate decarboxylase
MPGSLADDQRSTRSSKGEPEHSFVFRMSDMTPNVETKSGKVQIADSKNFNVSKTVAAALVTVKPGGLRELHWHPNADEWQYYVQGEARMTVFDTGPKAQTADFKAGDIGYVKKSQGHYVENVGTTDLVFLEIFKTDTYAEVSLSEWLSHAPAQMVMEALNVSAETYAKFPKNRSDVVPA